MAGDGVGVGGEEGRSVQTQGKEALQQMPAQACEMGARGGAFAGICTRTLG